MTGKGLMGPSDGAGLGEIAGARGPRRDNVMASGDLASHWRHAPRRWGHNWHAMCSYMAMFPPTLPHTFIRWLTEPGEVVYDPFSGRGTTVLEACLLGRVGLASDASPLACVLSSAKAQPPSEREALKRIEVLRAQYRPAKLRGVPNHVRILFSDQTLRQLLWLREHLNLARRTDRYLMATLLGILHLNARSDGTPRGLSVSMPNTFSMAPGYVSRYVADHQLKPPIVDVFDAVATRVVALGAASPGFRSGTVWSQDVRDPIQWPKRHDKAALVFTSPPYLQVMKYGKMNWLRLWMLGHEPRVIDDQLFASASLGRYLDFMRESLVSIRARVRNDGFVCLVIGDVRRGEQQINLAAEVAVHSLRGTELHVLDIVNDHLPVERKVSRIWGQTRGRATKVDRILILGAPQAKRLPRIPSIDWTTSREQC